MSFHSSGMPIIGAKRRALPDLGVGNAALSAISVGFLLFLIVLPLTTIFRRAGEAGFAAFWQLISAPEAVFALRYSLLLAIATTLVNACMGTLLAYALVRGRFPGKRLVDTLVDLPMAIPASVTGFTLLLLYGPLGLLGGGLSAAGIQVMFAFPGILLAHSFTTFPYTVRAVGSLLEKMERIQEEAAQTLGAGALDVFRHVTLPAIRGGIIIGSIFTFARSLGEFGATVMVSGNLALRTQTAPLFIFSKFNQGDIEAASAMSVVLVSLSFVLFFGLKLGLSKFGIGGSV